MKIQVTKHYVGANTGGAMIYPGEYDAGDSLLYGLDAYLVEIGYAVFIEEPQTVVSEPVTEEQEFVPLDISELEFPKLEFKPKKRGGK